MALTTDTRIEQQSFSNRSYNLSRTAIQGFVTDLEALSQAIHKRLSTQQFEYPIYSFDMASIGKIFLVRIQSMSGRK